MKRLKIMGYTPELKTENGNIGTRSEMLKLHTLIEDYNGVNSEEKINGKAEGKKSKNIELYKIKGLKGWLRHKYMEYYFKNGIEICYPSSKESFKDRKVDIPHGFHYLGGCEGKCPIYNIFGGVIAKKDVNAELSKPSKITVWSEGVITKKHFSNLKDDKLKEYLKLKYNVMHFDSEHSICLGFNGESIQNFEERFVAGDFEFFIDVSKLNNEELKEMVKVLLNTETRLGRAKTRGCGKVEIRAIKYEKIIIENKLNDDGTISRTEKINDLNKELYEICNGDSADNTAREKNMLLKSDYVIGTSKG